MPTYKVKSGDTLSKIAQQYGVNTGQITGFRSGDPNLIYPGENLNIPYQAKQEAGLGEIQQSLSNIQSQIPDLSADISSLTSSANIDTSNASVLDTNAGDIIGVGNGLSTQYASEQASIQAQQAKLAQEEQARATQASEQKQTYLDKISGLINKRENVAPVSTEDLYKKTLAEYGLTPEKAQALEGLMGQLTTYNEQMVALEDKKQTALDRVEDRPGIDLEFMGREQSQVNRKYNREITAKAAQAGVVNQQIQLQRRLFDDARTTADKIVQYATYDQQQKVADMDWAINTYADLFDIMDASEKESWDRAYDLQKDELSRQQTEMTNKLNLMTNAAENGVNLGWDMNYMNNKSLEELTAEYGQKVSGAVAAEGIESTTEDEAIILTDDEIRANIRGDIRLGKGYQEVIDAIILNPTIANKDRAMLIARELFNIKEPTPTPKKATVSGGFSPLKQTPLSRARAEAIGKQPADLSGIEAINEIVGSFMSSLQ